VEKRAALPVTKRVEREEERGSERAPRRGRAVARNGAGYLGKLQLLPTGWTAVPALASPARAQNAGRLTVERSVRYDLVTRALPPAAVH
jgi:hypothetical protein